MTNPTVSMPPVLMTGQNTTGLVRAALAKSGYTIEFDVAIFHGISAATGRQVHVISFFNDAGEPETGEVFIDNHGKAEF